MACSTFIFGLFKLSYRRPIQQQPFNSCSSRLHTRLEEQTNGNPRFLKQKRWEYWPCFVQRVRKWQHLFEQMPSPISHGASKYFGISDEVNETTTRLEQYRQRIEGIIENQSHCIKYINSCHPREGGGGGWCKGGNRNVEGWGIPLIEHKNISKLPRFIVFKFQRF